MINIYDAEKRDNLETEICNNKISVAASIFDVSLEKNTPYITKGSIINSSPNLINKASILVSTGWNNNDDVFDKKELYDARLTPIHQKINLYHVEKDIVGHMINSAIADRDGHILQEFDDDDNSEYSLPDIDFDIVTGFVIYKLWSDKDRSSEIQDVLEKINNNELYMSMECMFKDFDYAIIEPDGTQTIIQRNQNTSFLTKYLRIYGGSGTYNSKKIGRVLRNIIFTGQALVNKPANARSIIFNEKPPQSFSQGSIITKVDIMNEEEIKKMQTDLAVALAKLADYEAKEVELAKASEQSLNSEIESLKSTNNELGERLSTVASESSNKDNIIVELNKSIAELNSKNETLSNALQAIETAKAFDLRVKKLVDAGITSEEAVAKAKLFDSLKDEQFEAIAAVFASKTKVPSETTTTVELAKASIDEKSVVPSQSHQVSNLEVVTNFFSRAFLNNKE